MATTKQIQEANIYWAYLLRGLVFRIDRSAIQHHRLRNLPTELADSMRALCVASRTTMEFITRFADRFKMNLGESTTLDGDGHEREIRSAYATIPEALAGDIPGHSWNGKRFISWAMLARQINFEALRVAIFNGPAFFVTFAHAKESEHDTHYFDVAKEDLGRRWTGVIPGENMQSPRQHRAWFQLVSPFAHGHDEKAGNVVLFRRQRQIDPFTGEQAMVPIYTGNAVRGQWRDMMFERMLRILAVDPESLPPMRSQELFAGGSIGAGADGQKSDLASRRKARSMVPGIALLGGCIDQQILSGALAVNDCTLLCRENAWKLFRLMDPRDASNNPLTYEEFAASLKPADDLTSLRLGVRHAHRDLQGSEDIQMLWNTEHVLPGARMLHTFQVKNLPRITSLALSCLSDLLEEFGDVGQLGAQTSRAYGQVSTIGYMPAPKATPLPSADEYNDFLFTNRDQIVGWLMGEKLSGGEEGEKGSPKGKGRGPTKKSGKVLEAA